MKEVLYNTYVLAIHRTWITIPIVNLKTNFGHTTNLDIFDRDLSDFSEIAWTRADFFSETGTTSKHGHLQSGVEGNGDAVSSRDRRVDLLCPLSLVKLQLSSLSRQFSLLQVIAFVFNASSSSSYDTLSCSTRSRRSCLYSRSRGHICEWEAQNRTA